MWRQLLASGLLSVLAACSSYPLPEDVLPVDSGEISFIVRCQTRNALREVISDLIKTSTVSSVYDGMSADAMIAWLDQDTENFTRLDWRKFAKPLRDPILFYKDTLISYDFSIDSMEMNTAGVGLGFFRQLPIGSQNYGVTLRNDRTRQVTRQFRVFDTFDSLARLMPERACGIMPKGVNYVYPIAGLIKIRSLVRTFLALNQYGNLGGKDADYKTATMSDTIRFTTKSAGNFDPVFMQNPVNNVVVPNANVMLDNSRQDLHTVIVVLQLPVDKSKIPKFDATGRLALSPSEARKVVAASALDQQRAFNTQDALVQLSTNVNRLTP